jgi:hypothetical protein
MVRHGRMDEHVGIEGVAMTLCKYGLTTFYTCGEVESKNAWAFWVGPPWESGNYISVNDCDTDMSSPGDSGGPVFNGNLAYAIVSGEQFGGLLCHDELVAGALNYAENALAVTTMVVGDP